MDARGAVAGITTAIAAAGGGYIGQQSASIGVGFAIPVNAACTHRNRAAGRKMIAWRR